MGGLGGGIRRGELLGAKVEGYGGQARAGGSGAFAAVLLLPRQPYPQPSRQFLRELPGDAARTRAARGRPFQRFALERVMRKLDAEVTAIALHHRKVLILPPAMQPDP